MAGKVVESKLKLTTETDARGIKAFQAEIEALTSKVSALKDIRLPDWMAGAPGGGGGGAKRMATGSPRSTHAPSPDKPGFDSVTMRGGTGWGGQPYFGFRGTGGGAAALGFAGRAPSMAARMVGGTVGGGGLAEIGGIMAQAGGGLMGAFGGFGAVLGLPLLAAGATFGLARMMAEPGIQYNKATYGLAARMGRPFVEQQRKIGVRQGISPMDMAQYLGQLSQVGAQKGFGALAELRGQYGIMPEQSLPFLMAATRAGGAGGRTEQDYNVLKRALLGMAKDVHSLPEIMEAATTAIEGARESLGELSVQGTREIMGLTKWMQESPSAALRGGPGGRLLAGMIASVATPGAPGKEMFLWSAVSRDPGIRESFRKGFPHLAGMMPETGPLSYFQTRMLRETPGGLSAALRSVMKQGNATPLMLMGLFEGMKATTAGGIIQRYTEAGGVPEDLVKLVEGEMAPPLEAIKGDVAKQVARLDDIKRGILGPDGIYKVLEAEEKVMSAVADMVKGKAFTAAIDSLPKIAEAVANLSRGEFGQFFDKMTEAVADGMRQALGLGPMVRKGSTWEAEQAEGRMMSLPIAMQQRAIENFLTKSYGWDFTPSRRVYDWVWNIYARPR